MTYKFEDFDSDELKMIHTLSRIILGNGPASGARNDRLARWKRIKAAMLHVPKSILLLKITNGTGQTDSCFFLQQSVHVYRD
mmetsp:Transcript_18430/g.42207  ORF Transcript_18430/g.42207 Transcript_18430/m.42207 type:complete len:82 (-) Transcript_18430:951-1196(-)